MKHSLKTIFLLFYFIYVHSSCLDNSYHKENVLAEYGKRSHYGYDIISIRENNTFTREDCTFLICSNYKGKYNISGDTIQFDYKGRKRPKDELNYMLKRNESIIAFKIYININEQYSNLDKDQLKTADRNDLIEKDTAMVEYKLIK